MRARGQVVTEPAVALQLAEKRVERRQAQQVVRALADRQQPRMAHPVEAHGVLRRLGLHPVGHHPQALGIGHRGHVPRIVADKQPERRGCRCGRAAKLHKSVAIDKHIERHLE